MNLIIKVTILSLLSILCYSFCWSQSDYKGFTQPEEEAEIEDFHVISGKIDFDFKLREWDGFGVNCVQTAHTRDYSELPQEYLVK